MPNLGYLELPGGLQIGAKQGGVLIRVGKLRKDSVFQVTTVHHFYKKLHIYSYG
ncbi:hypothetical protein [Nostoc sp.]|uniref:hypothetical protein n=1 Tax=Nostoc sp. TaxID=1180 RepID=UPI001681CF4A|nr:hypothetical protein [Desmonostoc muscorum FACHB-395]